MKKKIPFIILHFILVILLTVFDQFTKYLVQTKLPGNDVILWDGVFRLTYVQNTGAAWGMFSSMTGILTAVSAVILIAVIVFYCLLPWGIKKLVPLRAICIFVSAGAVGNMIDRIRLKYVVDFFYFELIDFPVFNVADIFITVSMFVLLFLFIFYYKEEDLAFLKKNKNE